MDLPRSTSVRGLHEAVASADHLATQAGMLVLGRGGNAVDAAIAANAAIAVTAPHLCGIGGDLLAVVHTGRSVVALNASGRAGSGADAEALRRDGHVEMPFRHHPAAITVPGCVDGWVTLHARFGALPLAAVFEPAIALADEGFPAAPLLIGSLAQLDETARPRFAELLGQATRIGAPIRRPGVARVLRAVAAEGRSGCYQGEFGAGLLEVAAGTIEPGDLGTVQADWVDPLTIAVYGHELSTIPPNSQGYLILAAAGIMERLGVPDDPSDPAWLRATVDAAIAAGHDRNEVLHEGADGASLVRTALARADAIARGEHIASSAPSAAGDTTYLCTADRHGMAVSLIQSNAADFGSWLVEPSTGINLHSRGIGFSLRPGHPAELAPGRRPPHTLSPGLATSRGEFVSTFGTMGGDGQPQILLQLATRMFHHGHGPARAVDAPRWVLRNDTGFDTWGASEPTVLIEGHAAAGWEEDLVRSGRPVRRIAAYDSSFGHAHAIVREPTGGLAAWADPRARVSAAAAR